MSTDIDTPTEPATPSPGAGHRPGTWPYVRIVAALFVAGLATFALLYSTPAVLPDLAAAFGLTSGASTLAVSVTAAGLGVALLVAGPISDRRGRTALIHASLPASAVVAGLCALAPTWPALLGLRFAEGVVLAGLPAVATAYLREEIAPAWASAATGLYIGGTAIGGMSGRLITGLVAEWFGWRVALGSIGVLAVSIAVGLGLLLPAARRFVGSPLRPDLLAENAGRMLLDRGLLTLYALGFTSMGAFVAAFNGLAFRLVAPPFDLGVGLASVVFVTYSVGSFSSPWAGRLAARHGSRTVVPLALLVFGAGVALTLIEHLGAIALGVGLITFGFFAAHGTTSGWVTARAANKGRGTGMAGALYLAFYYTGSSVFGALAGSAWSAGSWPAVATLTGSLVLVALGLAVSMRWVPPVPTQHYDQPQP